MEVSGKRQETDISTEICKPCLAENNSKPADGFCRDCEEFMCEKCFHDHLKAKSCRNHVLGSLQDESSSRKQQTEKWKKHTTENIKYYCRTHYSVACGDCVVCDHRKCKPEFIKDIAKNFEESPDFQTFLRQIQEWETDTDESVNCIESNRKQNKTLLDIAIASVRNIRKDINDWLDIMEKNLETEVKEMSDENEIQMSELEVKIKSVKEEINGIKDELNPKVYSDDSLFIRAVECMPKIDNVCKSVIDIKSKIELKAYTFEPETKVNQLLKSLKLGIIKVASEIHTEKKQTKDMEQNQSMNTKKKHKRRAGSSAANIYQLPDPRAAGFDVGKRVKCMRGHYMGFRGTVTEVEPSGYVIVKFGNLASVRYKAGAEGQYEVKLE